MVFIPNINRTVRAPNVRVDVASAGGVGRGLQQAGQFIGSLADKWQAERDSASMTQSQLQLSEWANTEIDRINSLKGYEAEGAAKKFSEDYRSRASDIANTTATERVRGDFMSWADGKRIETWSGVARYERSQQQAAATATTDLRYQQIQNDAERGIGRDEAIRSANETAAFSVASGVAIPAEAQLRLNKEINNINNSAFKYQFSANPDVAIRKLNDFDLTEPQKMAWREKYSDDQWQKFNRQNAFEKLMVERQELAIEQNQNNLMVEGFTRQEEGTLDPGWYDANAVSMAPADRLYFGRAVGRLEPSENSDNSTVVNELNSLAAKGKDEELRETARRQYVNGNISTDTYELFLSGKMAFDTSMKKEGADFIQTKLRVSDMNPDPAAPQRQAEALSQWNQYVRDNPNASEESLRKEYQRIANRFVLIDTSDSMLTMELPRGIGVRSGLTVEDIDSAEDKLAADIESGSIEMPEFERQADLLSRWRTAVIKQQEARTQRSANGE